MSERRESKREIQKRLRRAEAILTAPEPEPVAEPEPVKKPKKKKKKRGN